MPTIGPNGQLLYGPTEVAQDYANLWGANLRNQASQFELGQARQVPIWNQLMALRDMQNPQIADILSAVGSGTRLGGDPSGVIGAMTDEMRNGNPNWGGFVRRMSLMGVPAGQQLEATYERGGMSPTLLNQPQKVFDRTTGQYTYKTLGEILGYPNVPGRVPGEAPATSFQGAPQAVGTAGAPDIEGAIGQASQDTGIPQPVLHAMFTQESSLGRTSSNIGQITEGTARNPGFNMPALTPDQVNDPATNIAWSARYLKARGEAAGVTDWNDPGQVATALREYNGGGDPNYVQHVFGHMAFQPYRVASNAPVAAPGAGAAVTPAAAATRPAFGDIPPPGYEHMIGPTIERSNALQAQMQDNETRVRPLLDTLENDLDRFTTTGVSAQAHNLFRQLLVASGLKSQTGALAETQADAEQFNKVAQMLAGDTMTRMGTPSDQRAEMAREMNPGMALSYLGNKGIIHMLKGNLQAQQAMGMAWQKQLNAGTPPAMFDSWRNNFMDRQPDGARFDPRVFWMSNMSQREQDTYFKNIKNPAEQQQLLKNMDYMQHQGFITPGQGAAFEATQ